MADKPLARIVADNIKKMMARQKTPYSSARKLALDAGVSANSVSNLLDPTKRLTTAQGQEHGFPRLDIVAAVAGPLDCEVWELMHPDLERAQKERELYSKAVELVHEAPAAPAEEAPDAVRKIPTYVPELSRRSRKRLHRKA